MSLEDLAGRVGLGRVEDRPMRSEIREALDQVGLALAVSPVRRELLDYSDEDLGPSESHGFVIRPEGAGDDWVDNIAARVFNNSDLAARVQIMLGMEMREQGAEGIVVGEGLVEPGKAFSTDELNVLSVYPSGMGEVSALVQIGNLKKILRLPFNIDKHS